MLKQNMFSFTPDNIVDFIITNLNSNNDKDIKSALFLLLLWSTCKNSDITNTTPPTSAAIPKPQTRFTFKYIDDPTLDPNRTLMLNIINNNITANYKKLGTSGIKLDDITKIIQHFEYKTALPADVSSLFKYYYNIGNDTLDANVLLNIMRVVLIKEDNNTLKT
jgi:hypothetical protein